jgi:putative oxygen-independent coproporphyrinogen III oxidase
MSAAIPVPESATAFGVYVHWPFCAAKCPYCDFNSHVRHQPPDEERFVAAFARELSHFAALTSGREVTSIFFGGGTPSLMQASTVAAILERIARLWPVSPDAEITLEANPGSAEAQRFRGYRAAGVNRLSLGVQSFDDSALHALGRIHSVAEGRAAIELARKTFPRLSFDLIYARPGQTLRAWETELKAATELAADHLSLYQLTIEPETPFFRLHEAGKLKVPPPTLAAEFYALTQAVTDAAGLPAYEISNHAVPGAESRHNLTYWRYRDYVGVGPGAHGRLSVGDKKRATMNEKHPEHWLEAVERAGHGLVVDETLTLEEAADEMLLMGLRLREGIAAARYLTMSGRDFSPVRLSFLREHGFIEPCGDGRLRSTRDGWLVLDSVVADLAA